jgi:hypothetical protein
LLKLAAGTAACPHCPRMRMYAPSVLLLKEKNTASCHRCATPLLPSGSSKKRSCNCHRRSTSICCRCTRNGRIHSVVPSFLTPLPLSHMHLLPHSLRLDTCAFPLQILCKHLRLCQPVSGPRQQLMQQLMPACSSLQASFLVPNCSITGPRSSPQAEPLASNHAILLLRRCCFQGSPQAQGLLILLVHTSPMASPPTPPPLILLLHGSPVVSPLMPLLIPLHSNPQHSIRQHSIRQHSIPQHSIPPHSIQPHRHSPSASSLPRGLAILQARHSILLAMPPPPAQLSIPKLPNLLRLRCLILLPWPTSLSNPSQPCKSIAPPATPCLFTPLLMGTPMATPLLPCLSTLSPGHVHRRFLRRHLTQSA